MIRALVFALTLITLAGIGLSEDGGSPAAAPDLDPVAQFLGGLAGLDEALCGTNEFEIRFRETKIGAAKLTVSPAAEGSGAVYELSFEARMAAGADAFEGKETTLLDEKLAIVRSDVWRSETRAGKTVLKVTTLEKSDGTWSFSRKVDDQAVSYSREFDGLVHSGSATEILLVGRIARSEPGTYTFRGIDWPEPEDAAGAQPAVKDLVVSIESGPDIHVSGEALPGRKIMVTRVDGQVTEYLVSTAGAVGRFAPAGSPVEFVSDKYSPPPPPRGETPAAAVKVYLRVLAGSLPASALDGVMDWAALMDWLAPDPPTSLVAFASGLKEKYASQAGAITDAQVAVVMPLVIETVEGDKATVALPGQEDKPFSLVKKETGWFIVRFPK